MNTQTIKRIKSLSAAMLITGVVFTGAAFCGCSSQQNSSAASGATAAATQATEAVTEQATDKATDPATIAATSKQEDYRVSMEDAVSIAMIDAGFALSEVQFTKQELDTDDGVPKYEIDFINGETEYEYEINAQTGAIIEKSTELVND